MVPPQAVAPKVAEASCTIIDAVIDAAEELTFWSPRETLQLPEEAGEWQRSRILQGITIERLEIRPASCPPPVSGSSLPPCDDILWFRTLDDRVFGIVEQDRNARTFGWTVFVKQHVEAALAAAVDVDAALLSLEAAISSLHLAMLHHQARARP